MGFRFRLVDPACETLEELETNEGNWRPGDMVIAHGNRRYCVTAVIPVERIAEFVDGPLNGVLEVEPI